MKKKQLEELIYIFSGDYKKELAKAQANNKKPKKLSKKHQKIMDDFDHEKQIFKEYIHEYLTQIQQQVLKDYPDFYNDLNLDTNARKQKTRAGEKLAYKQIINWTLANRWHALFSADNVENVLNQSRIDNVLTDNTTASIAATGIIKMLKTNYRKIKYDSNVAKKYPDCKWVQPNKPYPIVQMAIETLKAMKIAITKICQATPSPAALLSKIRKPKVKKHPTIVQPQKLHPRRNNQLK